MAQRTPQDECLLCKNRLASKRNSHIFPRFWVRTILGDANQKQAYTVGSATARLGQKIQDSPKEDYILCPECESRFGVLERYVANSFYNPFKSSGVSKDFPLQITADDELDKLFAPNVNSVMFKLFIYSLVWRASISNHPVFENFKLSAVDEESIRQIIDSFLKDSEAETLDYIAANLSQFKSLPVSVVTTLGPADTTANLIAPFNVDDEKVLLFANEFMIVIYLDWSAPHSGGEHFNLGVNPLCIGVVPLTEWDGYHTAMVEMLVSRRRKNGLN